MILLLQCNASSEISRRTQNVCEEQFLKVWASHTTVPCTQCLIQLPVNCHHMLVYRELGVGGNEADSEAGEHYEYSTF